MRFNEEKICANGTYFLYFFFRLGGVMDRNTKISFGVLASAYALTVAIFSVRLRNIEKLLAVVDQTQDKMLSHMDAKFQQEVDMAFGEITDNYDE
jgi:hypothetical protein